MIRYTFWGPASLMLAIAALMVEKVWPPGSILTMLLGDCVEGVESSAIFAPAPTLAPQQLFPRRVELRVLADVALTERSFDGHVHGARVALHVDAVGCLDTDEGQAEDCAVHEPYVRGVDNPAGRRLAHHLAELQAPVAFGEVLRVGERVLVCDDHCRQLKRPLSQVGSRRGRRKPARRHTHVTLAREHVDGIDIDEAAVVVADIKHHALPRLGTRG